MVEQYATTSKTFGESYAVNQIFTVDQVSLFLLPVYFRYIIIGFFQEYTSIHL